MIFSLDRTRSFIRVAEPNLLSLYRSDHPIIPAAKYCQGHLCDAFICVINEYNLWRVFVALHDQLLKSNLIFVTDPIRPDEKNLAALVQNASVFVTELGFAMETVKVDFSPAIREVIIRDTKVMREPSLALQLEAALLAVEALQAEKKELSRKGLREQALLAEVEELRAKLMAVAAIEQVAIQLPAVTGENVDLQAEQLNSLQKEMTLLQDQKEYFHRRAVHAEETLQKSQEELGNAKAALKTAREGLRSGKDAAKQAKEELKSAKQEALNLAKQLKHEQLECVKARNELEAVQSHLQESETIQGDILADKEAAEALHQAEIKELKAKITTLTAELGSLDSTNEIEVLRSVLAVAEESLAFEKTKNESALQEMDALERNAASELKSLKKKVDAFSAEKQLLEKMALEMKNKAHGEIEYQQQVNQSQRRAAIKKLNALKEEIRQLSQARAVIASPDGIPLVPVAQNVSLPAGDNQNPFGSQLTSFSSDPFGSYESSEFIDFVPDKTLSGIPYSASTDIIEIYRSYNKVHAAPTGKKAQKCDGFICMVSGEGGRNQVYVAWLMNSSGEVLVCRPEAVKEAREPGQVFKEGIGYFERIGFIIDKVNLVEDQEQRQIQLNELNIFYRTTMDFAA